jgi:cyclophilin family peptidyl-prolyl cis-trans isomerase
MAFSDEYLGLTHDSPYLVTMVKPGSAPDSNNSQFMITLAQTKFLDHKYEIIGRLANTSFALADKISDLAGTDGWSDYETPNRYVKIVDCLLTDPTPFPTAVTDTLDPLAAPDLINMFVQEQIQYNFNLGYDDFSKKYS